MNRYILVNNIFDNSRLVQELQPIVTVGSHYNQSYLQRQATPEVQLVSFPETQAVDIHSGSG